MKQAIASKAKGKQISSGNVTGSQTQQTPPPNLATVIICAAVAKPDTIKFDSREARENDSARQTFIDGLIAKLRPPTETDAVHPLLDEIQSHILLKYFVQQNCREMVSALLKKGAQYIFARQEYMPFHLALTSPNPDPKMVEIFLNHDPNLANLPAYSNETPLTLIVFSAESNTLNQNIQIINMFLDRGADPYEKLPILLASNHVNLSAMDLAIREGFWQIIKALTRTIPPITCAERDIQTLTTLSEHHGHDLKKFRFLLAMLCKTGYVSSTSEDETDLGVADLVEVLRKIDANEIKRFTDFEGILKNSINLKNTLLGILGKLLHNIIKNVNGQITEMSFEEMLSMKRLILEHCDMQSCKGEKTSLMMQKKHLASSVLFFSSFIDDKNKKLDFSLDLVDMLFKHLDELNYCAKTSSDLECFKAEIAFYEIIEKYNLAVITYLENYISISKDDIHAKNSYAFKLLRLLENAARDFEIYHGKHNLLNRAQGVCFIIQSLSTREKDDILCANDFIKSYSYLGFTEMHEWQEFKKLKNETRMQAQKRKPASTSSKMQVKHENTQTDNDSSSVTSVETRETTSPSLDDEIPFMTAELIVTAAVIAVLKTQEANPSLQDDSHETPTISPQNTSEFNSPTSSVLQRHTFSYDKTQNILSKDEKTIVDLFELPPNIKGKLVCTDATENRWSYFELDPEDFSDSRQYNRFFTEFNKAKPHFVKTTDNWVAALAPGGVDERVFSTEQIKQEKIKPEKDKQENIVKTWRLLRFNRIGDHSDYNKPMGNLHYKL